jgi:hypothetical protein
VAVAVAMLALPCDECPLEDKARRERLVLFARAATMILCVDSRFSRLEVREGLSAHCNESGKLRRNYPQSSLSCSALYHIGSVCLDAAFEKQLPGGL